MGISFSSYLSIRAGVNVSERAKRDGILFPGLLFFIITKPFCFRGGLVALEKGNLLSPMPFSKEKLCVFDPEEGAKVDLVV